MPQGPPKNNYLRPSTIRKMPKEEQNLYKQAFKANKADRKARREEMKWDKAEKQRIARQLAENPLGDRKWNQEKLSIIERGSSYSSFDSASSFSHENRPAALDVVSPHLVSSSIAE
jgi:TPP-dependent indolepyruvate ferredoxin oxidoreductase alpha subunit